MSGTFTAELSVKLNKRLENNNIRIFHDHGDIKSDFKKAIKLIIGEDLKFKNKISEADIIIVNESEKKVIMLIEIEEEGTLSPKKMMGDICSFIIMDNVYIKKDKYSIILDKTKFLVSGLYNEKGNSKEKLETIMKILMSEINRKRLIKLIIEKDKETLERKIIEYFDKNVLHHSA